MRMSADQSDPSAQLAAATFMAGRDKVLDEHLNPGAFSLALLYYALGAVADSCGNEFAEKAAQMALKDVVRDRAMH